MKRKVSSLFFYKLAQNIMFSYKLKVLKKILQPSDIILDYGSGDGHFAEFLKKQKINVHVYDPIKNKSKKSQIKF